MNGIILYQSKYGATKQYAEWLAEETGFSLLETKKARIEEVQQFDTVILGGGVYASGVAGLAFLKKHGDALRGKELLVFIVGASPYDEENFRALVARNMTGELRGIPCFYCRGAWDLAGMNVVDRNLCKMLQKSVAKKPKETLAVWERALAEAGEACDWTDKAYLAPILARLRACNEETAAR